MVECSGGKHEVAFVPERVYKVWQRHNILFQVRNYMPSTNKICYAHTTAFCVQITKDSVVRDSTCEIL